MEKIYIIGHKSPDLDSVAAAISYAVYKNKLENTDKYEALIAGEANKETKYMLEQTAISMPQKLATLAEKEIIMVDHNEFGQAEVGIEEAKIVEILDHHKLDFKYSDPIEVCIKPWGSSCSIVFDMFKKAGIEIDANLAKLMLSAVLVDTVITKSPTCTEKDVEIIHELAQIAGVEDYQLFGMEVFKVRSDISDMSEIDIIKNDYKNFETKAGIIGIGQVETADLSVFEAREEALLAEMKKLQKSEGLHSVVLFLTDIINVGSKFLIVSSDMEKMSEALGIEIKDSRTFLEGVVSRKKQVAPMIIKMFG